MHNHDHKNTGYQGMMWMMIICCALLLVVLLLGGSSLSSGGYFWPVLIGIFVVAHIWMMFKGHGKHNDAHIEEKSDTSLEKESEGKNEHKHSGGCCH